MPPRIPDLHADRAAVSPRPAARQKAAHEPRAEPRADAAPAAAAPTADAPASADEVYPTLEQEAELWTAVKGMSLLLQLLLGVFTVMYLPWVLYPLGWSLIGGAVIYGLGPACAFASFLRAEALSVLSGSDAPLADRALRLAHLDWIHVPLLTSLPVIAVAGLFFVPLTRATLAWSVVYYLFTGFGITAGYHRLWAHRSYKAPLVTRVLLLMGASGAVQGSCRWWSKGHRVHHRAVDTPMDPYAATRGLFFSHIGWMLFKQRRVPRGFVQMTDLDKDAMLRVQHRYYPLFALFWGIVFPTVVAGVFWGDYLGGYFYAAVLRLVLVQHATFCVNSLAHWLGDATFTDQNTARDSLVTALVTLGEGNHNAHHMLPNEYRNGISMLSWDPTKWLIASLEKLGLAYDLVRYDDNEFFKARLTQQQRDLDRQKALADWGPDVSRLPLWTPAHVASLVSDYGRQLIIVDGFVHDVEQFMDRHPGGVNFLKAALGKDASEQFHGGVYMHGDAGQNMLLALRVARVE